MEWMDRSRRTAGVLWTLAGVLAMLVWTLGSPDPGAGGVTWAVAVVVTAGAVTQVASPRTRWWSARLSGAVIGVLLLGAVSDRIGLLGRPGSPGVSWGDWSHFRLETAELVPWPGLVQVAAVGATVAELGLGTLLIVGWRSRWTGKLAAGLFAVYLVAMVPGMGPESVLRFGIPVLIGGCLVASARGGRPTGPAPAAPAPAAGAASSDASVGSAG